MVGAGLSTPASSAYPQVQLVDPDLELDANLGC